MDANGPTRHFDLTVIGDASIDYFVRVPHIARNDNKAIGNLLGSFGGGMSANLAAAAAAQDAHVQLITKVGFDSEAGTAVSELQRRGVQTPHSVRDTEHRTWMCFIQLDESGEKALIGADTGIKIPRTEELDLESIRNSRIVAPLADDLRWATWVARAAKEGRAGVAIDLEPDAFEFDDMLLRELLDVTDIAFMNGRSAQKFSPDGVHAAARKVHEMGPSTVVVGVGAKGAYCSLANGRAYSARAPGHYPAVDTTGAGDALAGAFLGNLLRGASHEQCLARAVAQATACITKVGSRSYLAGDDPTHSDRFINQIPVTSERC